MFIAMNRFRIAPGREAEFIEIWRQRDSRLASVPGFQQFNLLQGATDASATVFISHSTWESAEAFGAWTALPSLPRCPCQRPPRPRPVPGAAAV